MAQAKVQTTRIVGVQATTVGMLQGTFFSLLGLIAAISHSLSATVEFARETESLLRGLTFGLAQGFLAIIFVPIIYFVIGWVLGSLYGVVLNAVLASSGGVVIKMAAGAGEKE